MRGLESSNAYHHTEGGNQALVRLCSGWIRSHEHRYARSRRSRRSSRGSVFTGQPANERTSYAPTSRRRYDGATSVQTRQRGAYQRPDGPLAGPDVDAGQCEIPSGPLDERRLESSCFNTNTPLRNNIQDAARLGGLERSPRRVYCRPLVSVRRRRRAEEAPSAKNPLRLT